MSLITATARASSPTRFNGANTAPVNFNPATCPIIARHWFGIEPFRPIGQIAAEVVADLRFPRQVQKLHRLGDRVLGELLAEIGAELSAQTPTDQKLDRYAELEPEALAATGGDRF